MTKKVSVKGLRGRWTPMTDPHFSDEHKQHVLRIVEEAKQQAEFMVEVRHSVWIGPGCAAEHDAITVCMDGAIYAMVYPDGHVS